MDEEEIEKAVIAYLKKKGFKQTELAFQEEQQHHHHTTNSSVASQTDTDIAKQILSFSEYSLSPSVFLCSVPSLFYNHINVHRKDDLVAELLNSLAW